MKQLNQDNQGFIVWGIVGAIALSGSAANIAFGESAAEVKTVLPAATVTRAINTAVEAQAGNVSDVEVETENGVTKVDVEIAAKDGKNYEVVINAKTGKIILVEVENNEMVVKSETNTKAFRTF